MKTSLALMSSSDTDVESSSAYDYPHKLCEADPLQLGETATQFIEPRESMDGAPPLSGDYLQQLVKTITSSVETLQHACAGKGPSFPRLDEPEPEGSSFELFRMTRPDAAEAARQVAAAAFQLTLAVLPPAESILGLISGHLQTAALRVCLESNVTEILREAGPQAKISQKANMPGNKDKLERILRYLATQHIYKEVRPHVFANTRLSSMMDTGKSVEELEENPDAKHDNTNGLPALLGHQFDEVAKSSAYLYETPSSGTATALNRAFGIDGLDIWSWYGLDDPEQQKRKKRFNLGMRGVAAMQSGAISQAYRWGDLDNNSLIVDVGGGLGTCSIALAKEFQELQFVVQDLEGVVEPGKKDISGRVAFEVQDFFHEQPPASKRKVAVFLLKQILHDWPDSECKKILENLRKAAQDDTRLILIDSVIPYACRSSPDDEESRLRTKVPSAVSREAPEPLLANYGAANIAGYCADMIMMSLMNGQERTLGQLYGLLEASGWEMKEVGPSLTGFLRPVVATPLLKNKELN
ncbi:S-adenosyl-L-methionine-dependent methyltransferase [Coprinopsis sp. MPI-PUGE-AT-0042]|nr:S-adenosyl-L-methionine-dependent methyltransferase [Coprinopsis sp. MPI-PUGE-AT-0042]